MAKIVKMNVKKMKTFTIPGIELKSDLISCFMLGIELIERRGLKIRKVLNDFMLELPSMPGNQVMTEIVTTKISSQFHLSLM